MVESRSPTPSDRQGFDRRWYAENLVTVYSPATAQEVINAWRDAVNKGAQPNELQITSGRHCYENFVYNENTKYIIDMTGLREFGQDPNYGFYIDAGNGNWDMFRIFNNVYNRTLPAGSCYSVGLGGHITGGGYGIFSRQWGLTVDHLTAVDMIVFTGSGSPVLVTASESENADLFWAARGGGGGNFGIITRYYFGDPPQSPTKMYTAAYTFDWIDSSGNVMSPSTFGDLLNKAYNTAEVGQGAPDPNFQVFHANHIAANSMVYAVYAFDVPGEGKTGKDYEQFVAERFRKQKKELESIAKISGKPGPINGHPWHGGSSSSLMPAENDGVYRNYTFLEGVQNGNGSGPNRFGKYKSAYMNKTFTSTMILALYEGLQAVPENLAFSDMATSLCQIDSYGCAINQVASNATAIPQRSSILKLQYQTYWDNDSAIGEDDPAQAAAHLDWINTMYSYAYSEYGGFPDPRNDPSGTVDGCYYNYPDRDLGVNGVSSPGIDNAMYLYFKDNFAEAPQNLASIKKRWNPMNWFNGEQSIPIS